MIKMRSCEKVKHFDSWLKRKILWLSIYYFGEYDRIDDYYYIIADVDWHKKGFWSC